MKRLILASLFFLLPIGAFAVPTKPEQFEKLENEFSLECQKYGAESCAARFISMAACTYVFAVNQGKHPDDCLLYTSPSPRDLDLSRMPSSA